MNSNRNPVAKFANKYNRASVHRDRKHDYKRKSKHKKNLKELD